MGKKTSKEKLLRRRAEKSKRDFCISVPGINLFGNSLGRRGEIMLGMEEVNRREEIRFFYMTFFVDVNTKDKQVLQTAGV
ncbi:hypothetical protein GWI33_001273 [Rhynchophorus ferrugineus]|uniref:Uncharacterized protein n=1 Tax=Rhynchophorus ferrugineus TaxID=354439 RepID=A0A834MGY4_RHYFE|nr:hypothetical protein GWI33_001273 [Rhynchophorus ferrugineus]